MPRIMIPSQSGAPDLIKPSGLSNKATGGLKYLVLTTDSEVWCLFQVAFQADRAFFKLADSDSALEGLRLSAAQLETEAGRTTSGQMQNSAERDPDSESVLSR